jgi:hypothetical protein
MFKNGEDAGYLPALSMLLCLNSRSRLFEKAKAAGNKAEYS